MTVYVKLTNNIVTDYVRVNPFNIFYPEYAGQFVEAPDEVNHGWSFDGEKFSPPPIDPNEIWYSVRLQRDRLLSESDTYVLPDRWAAMTPEKQQEWTTYRQALRDLPQTYSDPNDVVWPTKPE